MSFQDLEGGRPLPTRREVGSGSQNPSQAVAGGIFQINTAVSTFKRLVNELGSSRDTPEHRAKFKVVYRQSLSLIPAENWVTSANGLKVEYPKCQCAAFNSRAKIIQSKTINGIKALGPSSPMGGWQNLNFQLYDHIDDDIAEVDSNQTPNEGEIMQLRNFRIQRKLSRYITNVPTGVGLQKHGKFTRPPSWRENMKHNKTASNYLLCSKNYSLSLHTATSTPSLALSLCTYSSTSPPLLDPDWFSSFYQSVAHQKLELIYLSRFKSGLVSFIHGRHNSSFKRNNSAVVPLTDRFACLSSFICLFAGLKNPFAKLLTPFAAACAKSFTPFANLFAAHLVVCPFAKAAHSFVTPFAKFFSSFVGAA
eukprot:Gb_21906 [translate_table: standard]